MEQAYRESCERIKKQIDRWLNQGKTEEIYSCLQEHMEIIKYDNDLMTAWYLGKICEKEAAEGKKTVFGKEKNMENLLQRYLQLKFFLRRIENGILDEPELFYEFLSEKNVSEYELMGMIDSCIFCKEKVQAYFA